MVGINGFYPARDLVDEFEIRLRLFIGVGSDPVIVLIAKEPHEHIWLVFEFHDHLLDRCHHVLAVLGVLIIGPLGPGRSGIDGVFAQKIPDDDAKAVFLEHLL